MLTQEEYVNDVLALRRQGMTIAEIAATVGYHPATVSKWLRAGGPPAQREVAPTQRVIDERWQARIAELVTPPSRLLATSVFEVLVAEGFDGSYPSVVRAVRDLRGPRFRAAAAASVPIETAPGGGVPVRLVRLQLLHRGLGPGRGVLLRRHPVLEPVAAVVVLAPASTGSTPSRAWWRSSRPPAG